MVSPDSSPSARLSGSKIVSNYGYSIRRYLGNGDGTFQPGVDYLSGSTVDMIVGDFNGDGFPDVVVSDYESGPLDVALNDGHGGFPTRVTANPGGDTWAFAAGDFDGDGHVDIVAPHWRDNTVAILRGNGDGTFQDPISYTAGQSTSSSPTSAAVGDFDGDGYPDIAVTNNRTNQVAVLLDRPNAVRLQVTTPVNPVAGSAFTMTVAALDAGGTVASNFRGTVHLTATDPAASLPADYTFTAADRGVKTFTATLRTAGRQTLTATDTDARQIMGSTTFTVSPAAASSLVVAGFSSPVTAGQTGTVTVTARDPYGNTATGYRGSVHFSSTDPQASLPANYTFTSSDNGVHTFSATLKTAGSQSITATDLATTSLTATQAGIVVNPAAASQLQITAPATVAPRATFALIVRALDPYNNVATGYRRTLHFTVSDPRAMPLPDYTFTAADAGVHQFLTGLVTVGTQAIAVQDQVNRISGSANVTVVLAPIFDSAINLNAGARPRTVATGDFNGDGIQDLVVANESGNNITVILGLGDGTFLNGVNYPVGPAPTSVVAADFNGDGILDLAVADNGGNTVSLLLGNGDGTFQPARNLTVGSGPVSLAAADLNGDGLLDLAVANKNSNTVSVLLSNGDGTFQPAQNFPVDTSPWSVAVGDLNGDGLPDLVTANDALSVSLLLGRGDGTFRPAVNLAAGGASPRAVAVADVNGDGIPDLVTANYDSNTVSVYTGRGDGTFRTAVNYEVQSGPQSMLVADVNGDGFPDIVTADQGGAGVGVLVNRGDGTFQPTLYYRAGLTPLGIAVGDFNGDSAPDLAVANSGSINVSVLLNVAPAVSLTVTAPASRVADTPFSVTVTMQNAFGGPATGYRGTIHFASTDSAATLPADYTFTTADAGVHTFPVALHTLGNQTITVQDTATGAITGGATVAVISPALFYPAVNYPVGRGPASVAVGDVNGAGIPDLITVSAQDGNIGVLLGQGNGSFGSARFYPAGAGAGGVMLGDFNGDGRLDAVVSHGYSSPTVSVLFGNGDGSFRAPVDYPAGGYTSEIVVGDLNGDGMPEREIAADLESISIAKAAQLKPYWRVSMQALIKRAYEIKKIIKSRYGSLYVQLSRLGHRKEEPAALSPEEPTVVRDVIRMHQDHYGYDVQQLSYIARSFETHFRRLFFSEGGPRFRVVG